jgi:hypothetical protein
VPALIVGALLLFTTMLGRRDITTSHEARVVQTARQMAAVGWPWEDEAVVQVWPAELKRVHGSLELTPRTSGGRVIVNPWLVPVLNGQVRLHKPPLPYWCSAVMFRALGFSEFAARIVPAVLGAVATLLVYDLARRVLGQRSAPLAAAVWITSYFVLDEYRKAMADPYLAFFTLAAVWAWIAAADRPAPKSVLVFGMYISIALGVLAKGPVILVTILPAWVLARFVLRRRLRAPWGAHVGGIVIATIIALAWPAYVASRVPLAMEFWRYESIGELTDNLQKARPWWEYLGVIVYLPLPWMPMWIAGIAAAFLHGRRGFRSPRGRRRTFALAWFVLTVFLFSLANIKKPAYLLPVMPAQTLIVADALVLLVAFARRRGLGGAQRALAWMQFAIGLGFMSTIATLMWRSDQFNQSDRLTAGVAMAASLLVIVPLLLRKPRQWIIWQFAAYGIILATYSGIFTSGWDNPRSARTFARSLADYVASSEIPILLGTLPEDVSVYLPMGLPDGIGAAEVLIVLDDRKNRLQVTPQYLASRVYGAQVEAIERMRLTGGLDRGRRKCFRVRLNWGDLPVSHQKGLPLGPP